MSVIVKNQKNEVYMFTKGADDILKEYLKKISLKKWRN